MFNYFRFAADIIRMKLARTFELFSFENCDQKYIYCEDFCDFLKQKDNSVRKFNVQRTLKAYKGAIYTVCGREVVSVQSIIKYIFNYAQSCTGCKLLATCVEQELVGNQKINKATKTSFDLYQKIAKFDFKQSQFPNENIKIEESILETLVEHHKSSFTSLE